MTHGVGDFVAVSGVCDRSVLETLGGVVVETPSPLDANADATVGDLADSQSLALVGLAGMASARCHELSSGERWRLAIAQALSTGRSPLVIDCTAPFAPRAELAALALGLRHAGVTVYVVTNDECLVGYADRVVTATRRDLKAGPSSASTLDRTRIIHELLRGMTSLTTTCCRAAPAYPDHR